MAEDLPRYWLMAFNDRTRDGDKIVTIDLGVVIVAATSFKEALQEARARGLHPGGAARERPLKVGVFADPDVASRFTYRPLEGLNVFAALEVIGHEEATLPDDPEAPLLVLPE